MKKIVVLASGNGSNLQALIDTCKNGKLTANICLVVSDKKDAFALNRAKNNNIPAYFVDPTGKEQEQIDREIAGEIDKKEPDLIILAGYMRLLSTYFVHKYKGKIINIHPALLPSFPGVRGYEDAWEYGVKVSGCTVHFVDEGMDTGPIILQKVNPLHEDDTLESFKERGLSLEHQALPEAAQLFLDSKLTIYGRKVNITK